MQDVYFASSLPDGSVAITQIAPKFLREQAIKYLAARAHPDMTNETLMGRFANGEFRVFVEHLVAPGEIAKAVPTRVATKRIRKGDIPADRYFRNAWKLEGAQVTTDMPKARAIHLTRIRRARDKALAKLDIETMKGNDVQAQKQRLRDIPQTFDLTGAATPDALKALWPEELDEHRPA